MSLDAPSVSQLRRQLQEAIGERYLIEREIGQGGMARVFLARDQQLPRKLAIKLLEPALTSVLGVERFLREIQITARLQHPHILPLIESGRHGQLVYYIMPYVEGESLRELLAREGQLPLGQALWIGRGVADALGYAHDRGVVHRDVKPENILLSGQHPLLADFGIARAAESCATCEPENQTLAGVPIGTPAYMSPEQVEGQPADGRSDIYSLGCVLFEMLTGRPPFMDRSARRLMRDHLSTPPPALAELRPGVPPALGEVVARTMAKDPAGRFQSATELGLTLARLAASEVLAHETADPVEEVRRAARVSTPRRDSPVPVVPPPPAVAPTSGVGSPASERMAGLWTALLVFAATVIAAAAVLVTISRQRSAAAPPRASAESPPARSAPAAGAASIAVMPLADYSGDDAGRFLSEGLTDEVIAQLATIPGLKVISRTSVVALEGKDLTVPEIARTLGVRHVLEGSVQRSGDRIRITLQLIDAASDTHLWAKSYDGDLSDVIALRQEIGQKVASALAMAVPGTEAPEAAKRPAVSAAYDAYLRGNYWLMRTSRDALDRSIRAFEDAIRLDSSFAPAHAGLSTALRMWATIGYPGDREPYATMVRAAQAADRALALDSNLAAGHVARGLVRLYGGAPPDSALRDLQRGLALMPNSGAAHAGVAAGLARAGRWDQALAEMRAAVQLDPLSAVAHGFAAVTALGARQYQTAIEESRRASSLEPDFAGRSVIEAVAQVQLGHPEQCLVLDLAAVPEMRAICLHASGRRAQAAALIDSVQRAYAAGKYEKVYQLGIVSGYYARQGDAVHAAEWIERAFDRSPLGIEFFLLESGLFDPIRGDPRWRDALDGVQRSIADRLHR